MPPPYDYPVKGATFKNDTSAATGGPWYKIVVIAAATFNTLTATNWGGNTPTGVAYPAGTILYGHFTAFTLASGSVIAYKA